jgi:hypothetical protein
MLTFHIKVGANSYHAGSSFRMRDFVRTLAEPLGDQEEPYAEVRVCRLPVSKDDGFGDVIGLLERAATRRLQTC